MFLEVLASLVVAPMVALASAKRSQAQNVSFDVAAEEDVLSIATSRPDLVAVAVGAGMSASSFTDPVRARRWQEVSASATAAGLCTYTEDSAADFVPSDEEGRRFVAAGEQVLGAQLDRESYQGSLAVVKGDSHERPLAFEKRPVSLKRYAFSVAWCLFGFLVATSATSGLLPALALGALTAYGLSVTLVDFDTLFLDTKTFLVGTTLSWGLTIASYFDGSISQLYLTTGLIAALFWFLTLKFISVVFRAIRKTEGLGGGDLYILIATSGVPVAMTGSLLLAAYSMVATGLLAVLYVVARRLFAQQSCRDAFALGPFLAAGWMAVLPILQVMVLV